MEIKPLTKINKISDTIKSSHDHSKLEELVDESFTTYVFDDRQIVKCNETGEILDYVLMSDQYFYDNWITQFAIGEVNGKNYFDMNGWSELTNQFTKGVIVVHEETKQFLFLIPKFIEPNYSPNVKNVLKRLYSMGSQINFQHDAAEKSRSLLELSKLVSEVTKKDKEHDGVTSLIPEVIYRFYNISPKALKAAIYTRDTYKTVSPESPDFERLTKIFTAHFDGKSVSEENKKFVLKLTNNEFVFDNTQKYHTEGDIVKTKVEEPFDPLAD